MIYWDTRDITVSRYGQCRGIVYKMCIALCLTSPDFYVYDSQIGPDVIDEVDDVQAHRHICRNQSALRICVPACALWCARGLICLFMLNAPFVRLLLFSEVMVNATLTTLELWMRCEMWQSWAKRNVTKKKERDGHIGDLYSSCWSNSNSWFFSMWIKSHSQKLVHTWSTISERDRSRHDRHRRLVGIGRRNRKCKQE